MSELLDLVGQYFDPKSVRDISGAIQADACTTEKAIGAAMPTLLGAMTKNASDQQGAASLHQALVRDHDGSIFSNMDVLLGESRLATPTTGVSQRTLSGSAILDHILGTRRQRVEDGVSRASGLTITQTMKLMTILAPILMGAIGKHRKQSDLSAGGLGELFHHQREGAEAETLGGGFIGRIFDQDGDGDFDFADIIKFGSTRPFGRREAG